jgi:hypothetical protein
MKTSTPVFSAIHILCLLLFIGVLGACDLYNQEEAEEWEEPFYRLMATGLGDFKEIEWGFKRYTYFSFDPPRYEKIYEGEHQGEGWWQLEILERDVRQKHGATYIGHHGYLYLKAYNPNGGPVATRIILIDALGEESILQEDSGNGTVESVAQIEVNQAQPINPCPGCTGPGIEAIAAKVICAELHRQGLMDKTIFEADEAFGRYLRDNHKDVLLGYHLWAKPLVKWMQKSKTVTEIVNLVATPWSYEMAHVMGERDKGSTTGKILMFIGIPVCRIIGKVVPSAHTVGLEGGQVRG